MYPGANHFTLLSHLNSRLNDLVAILIFSFISIPLLWVPPEHFRKPFLFGSIIMTVTTFVIFIWALAKEGGGGPLLNNPSALSGVTPLSGGSELGWAMAYGISSTIGGICAGILNQSDYTRFASYPRAQIYSQLLVVPISSTIISIIGLIVTSCAADFYPDEGLLWAPYDLFPIIQQNGGPGARAACFFVGCVFVMSQFGINIPGNAISGGIDMSGLLPKYLNIKRYVFVAFRSSITSSDVATAVVPSSQLCSAWSSARGSCSPGPARSSLCSARSPSSSARSQ